MDAKRRQGIKKWSESGNWAAGEAGSAPSVLPAPPSLIQPLSSNIPAPCSPGPSGLIPPPSAHFYISVNTNSSFVPSYNCNAEQCHRRSQTEVAPGDCSPRSISSPNTVSTLTLPLPVRVPLQDMRAPLLHRELRKPMDVLLQLRKRGLKCRELSSLLLPLHFVTIPLFSFMARLLKRSNTTLTNNSSFTHLQHDLHSYHPLVKRSPQRPSSPLGPRFQSRDPTATCSPCSCS